MTQSFIQAMARRRLSLAPNVVAHSTTASASLLTWPEVTARRSLVIAVAVALALSPRPAEAAPTQFFVSPTGDDDAGDGSAARPWASLPRAATAVRGLNRAMTDDIVVNLRGGDYFTPATFTLTPADSGFNGHVVRYAAYAPDAAPAVIHAGVRVTGWTRVDVARNVWAAPLPGAVTDARQAYIGGARMNSTSAPALAHATVTAWGYTADDVPAFFDAHQGVDDIEFLYTGVGSSWTECRVRVQSVARLPGGGVNITMQQPAFSLARGKYYGQGVRGRGGSCGVRRRRARGAPRAASPVDGV